MKYVFEDHFVEWLQSRNISKDHFKRAESVKQNGRKFYVPRIYKFLVDELIVDPHGEDLRFGAKTDKPYFEIREGDGETEPHFLIVDWSKADKEHESKITFFAVNLMKPSGSNVKDSVLALRNSNVLNDFVEKYEKKLTKFSADIVGIPVVITKKGLFDFLNMSPVS